MSRVQLALRVSDLEGSMDFYRSLFGAEPAKRRPGYANFAENDTPAATRCRTRCGCTGPATSRGRSTR
jgi:catechol 2,3-dioxygenase-like lactoylglutathione lyase family enzyme